MLNDLTIAYQTERGRRPRNEDMLALPLAMIGRDINEHIHAFDADHRDLVEKGILALVADGVGGQTNGDVASQLIATQVAKRYYDDPSADRAHCLQRVVEAANRDLWQEIQAGTEMATTLTAAVIRHDQLLIAHVGDSRAYLQHDGKWHQLTADHTRHQRWLNECRGHEPADNRLARSMGQKAQVAVDLWCFPLEAHDRILLCSDGLSSHLDILTQSNSIESLQAQLIKMIDLAYDNGSQDNISGILIHIHAIE